jgi:hypothetical protein
MATDSGMSKIDPTRYGYTQDQWDRAVDAGVRILKDVAGTPDPITYTDLCERIFAISDVRIVPGEFALPHILGDISRETLRSDGCAITALVVYKDTADAGPGLYGLGIEEGLLPKNPTEIQKDKFRISHTVMAQQIWARQRHRPGERFK